MIEPLSTVYLARHGETAWSISGQHTGRTDLPLTERGERNARRLGERIRGLTFVKVLTSPLQRAFRTCALAGFGEVAQIEPNLLEWNYGDYEGLRTAEIHAKRPDWQLFRDGCPNGETPAQVGARADCVLGRIRPLQGDVLLFSSGHFLRVLAARWITLEPAAGRFFLLTTASLSALSYEHNLSQPAIRFWDDSRHAGD
ncbi:MAG TPA: histidine phosphatase family protein [Candidatus Cybelea sp.]|nr:histidine phosphatase family protein [Candidatus Cybelea sp.]